MNAFHEFYGIKLELKRNAHANVVLWPK